MDSLIDGKCKFLTQRLECLVGGEGTIECLDSEFHYECPFKKKLDEEEIRQT